MAQIFHPSMNPLSKVSIFGAVFILGALGWAIDAVNRSPWVTQVDVARGALPDAELPQGYQRLSAAIESYRRDFGDAGWLRDDVGELRKKPLRVRSNLFVLVADEAEMLRVPAGTYRIGSPQGAVGGALSPARTVQLGGFLIDRLEVSNWRYERFLAEWRAQGGVHRCGDPSADHARPVTEREQSASRNPDGPVVGVTAYDALEYARFYGRRLPSEDEWEVAASWDPQGAKARLYPWGEREPSAQQPDLANLSFAEYGVYGADGVFQALCTPGGTFELDRSGFGLLDVAGNAAEWCSGLPLPG